jgi:hypothetical protein
MLFTNIIMCVLLYYQVTMPAVENSKYHPAELNGKLYIMNTQNGRVQRICDERLVCEEVKESQDSK